MLKKNITFIFVLMAMTLFLTPAWGFTPDARDVEDQALTFFRNHEVAGTCVGVEFLESQSVLARGGGSGGGSGGSFGSGSNSGTSRGFGNNNGPHRMGGQGTNATQQNQHEHQYQQQQKTEKQNQHQYQYQHREESGAQN
jgi:hypothetical protein